MTIRTRLILSYVLVVVLSLTAGGLFFAGFSRRVLVKRAEAQLTSQGQVLAHFLSMYTQSEEDLPQASRWLMREFPDLIRARVRILDKDGAALADSAPELETRSPPPIRIQTAFDGETQVWKEGQRVHVLTPVRMEYPEPRVVALMEASSQLSEWDQTMSELKNRALAAAGLGLALSLILGSFLAFGLSSPIGRLREAADEISRGDLETQLPTPQGPIEIRELSESLSRMAFLLKEKLELITAERNKVRKLMDALPDPVLAYDEEGKITYVNRPARLQLQMEKENDFQLEESNQEFHHGGREYRANWLPFQETGKLLVLRDVTDLRRLEEVRNLFLGSVSHELRTPLTIIKGFASTLAEMDSIDPSLKTPLMRIDSEADRLTRLVSDLLDLTQFRSRRVSLELETVEPDEVVGEGVELFRHQAETRDLELRFEPGPECRVEADKDRLKQVVINLLGNALKFTPEGGRVVVSSEVDGDNWTLVVADTGPGIEAEELPHLFDHFFRGREQRKVGGTGLGLAVSKEIMTEHGGNLEAQSRVGEGTTFRASLPLSTQ